MNHKQHCLSLIIQKDCRQIADSINGQLLQNKRILLTGSNGLFGRYIAYLIYILNVQRNLNCTLYCISLHSPNKDIETLSRLDKNIIPIKMNLSKNFTFKHKVDYILHAACFGQPQKFIENPFSTIDLNVNATRKLLEVAKKNKAHFLFFSSAEVYGDIPKNLIPIPETYNGNCSILDTRSIYGESKRLGETICSIFRRDYHLKIYIIRLSHTYGPGISKYDKRVLGDFIRKAKEEGIITLLDQGKAVKTLGYIADMIRMLFNIILNGNGFVYNVGGVDSITIKKLAQEIAKYYKVPVILPKTKSSLLHIGNDPPIVKLDLSKYQKEFGLFNFTPLKEGIKRMLDWNKEKDS